MNLHLNLASQPFGRRRLFTLAFSVSAVVLGSLAIGLVVHYFQNYELSPQLVAVEARFRAQLRTLQAEEAELKRKLVKPENAQVLERSLFLNQLLHRKGISWTRTFADLEEIFPPRVRVAQVRPEVTPDNKLFLAMIVGAETPSDFIELLKVLEESELFGSPDVRGESPPTENDPVHKYSLSVSYDQQL